MAAFCCIAVLFNPVGYRSRWENYCHFRDRLVKQHVPLLTVELAFPGQNHALSKARDVLHLRSESILWQKERMLNYAISRLPDECRHFAWIDVDVLLPDGWVEMTLKKLESVEFVQLFQGVRHLQPGESRYGGEVRDRKLGIVWQNKTFGEDWARMRTEKTLLHAEPGFAWAARREVFDSSEGIYDRLICGSADNFLTDCLLDGFSIRNYDQKFTPPMQRDMFDWKRRFVQNGPRTVDYLPLDIDHLWHGVLKHRGYSARDAICLEHEYDPRSDIVMRDHVWEWASEKPRFHRAVIEYFHSRREDDR